MEKKQVKVYLSEKTHKALKVQAALEERTLSDIIEELSQRYLDEKKSP